MSVSYMSADGVVKVSLFTKRERERASEWSCGTLENDARGIWIARVSLVTQHA